MNNQIQKIKCKTSATKRKKPSPVEQDLIINSQQNRCFYCGVLFGEYLVHKKKLVFLTPRYDHIIPYAYCFNGDLNNFCAACFICNGIKSSKVFDTIAEIIKHVRKRRREKGLPNYAFCGNQITRLSKAEMMLEESVLHLDVDIKTCSSDELENMIKDLRRCKNMLAHLPKKVS